MDVGGPGACVGLRTGGFFACGSGDGVIGNAISSCDRFPESVGGGEGQVEERRGWVGARWGHVGVREAKGWANRPGVGRIRFVRATQWTG